MTMMLTMTMVMIVITMMIIIMIIVMVVVKVSKIIVVTLWFHVALYCCDQSCLPFGLFLQGLRDL